MDNEDSAVAQDHPEVHSKIKTFDINEARLLRKKLKMEEKERKINNYEIAPMKINSGGGKQEKDVEVRKYSLNEKENMKKKLKSTEKEPLEIIESNGGTKLVLNTGTYELLKFASKKYFSDNSLNYKYLCKPANDKKSNEVELCYKVADEKNHLYTFNMYHTTSSCLINGRNVSHFFDTDLPNILQIMNTDIQSHNKSISELNEYMKQQILSYLKRKNPKRPSPKMSVTYGVDEPDTLLDSIIEQDFRKEENDSQVVANAPCVKENAPLVVYNTETDLEAESEASFDIDCATQTDSVENAILKEMKMMNELLLATKFHLNNFQQETILQVSQLRDEITSIKNTISIANQQSTDKLETVSQSTDKLSKDMKQANDALQRKLQSVHDNIKKIIPSTAKRLVQNENKEKATTETPQYEKSKNNEGQHDRKETEQSPTEQVLELNTVTDIVDTANKSDKTLKTLLIGDSILSGINKRGLNKNTHIKTLPGRKIKDIRLTLDSWDMTNYENVIIYIGGNDMAEGGDARIAYREIKQLLHELNRHNCTVYLCTVAPRRDADVVPLNDIIKQICEETDAQFIELYTSFISENGNMAQHLYGSDGIHLHARGCSTLVANINKAVHIIKEKTSGQQDRQANRSNTLHSTQSGSNGYVTNASDRGSSRNGASRAYQLQTGSYGYKNNAPGRGSKNGYSRDGRGSYQTHTGSYGYGNHAPGHGLRNGDSRDGRNDYQMQSGSNGFRRYASNRDSRNGDSRDRRDGQKNLYRYQNSSNYGQQQRHCEYCHYNNHYTSECRRLSTAQ